MSRFGFNTQMLSRCGCTWLRASLAVSPVGTIMAVPLSISVRHVSTTRPKKAQAMKEALKETAIVTPVTKAPKASASSKTKKTTTKAKASADKEAKTTTQARKTEGTKTRASKTKTSSSAAAESTTDAAVKPTSTTKYSPAPTSKSTANISTSSTSQVATSEIVVPPTSSAKKQSTAAGSGRFTPSQQQAAPKSTPANAPVLPKANSTPVPPTNPVQTRSAGKSKARIDTSSPEYKQAEWKWTSTMIALPILLVTSYLLFDRLVLGNEPNLDQIREKLRGVTGSGPGDTAKPGNEVQTSNVA